MFQIKIHYKERPYLLKYFILPPFWIQKGGLDIVQATQFKTFYKLV